jgi:hypothetical protein
VLIGPAAVGIETEVGVARSRAVDLLRLHLLSAGVDARAFDRAMTRG